VQKRILIIGGTGMLGVPVARKLKADGAEVRIFTRDPDRAAKVFGPGYAFAAGDAEDRAALTRALDGCAIAHINLYGGLDPDLERRAAQVIAQAAADAQVERIGYLSGSTVCAENASYPGTRAKLAAEAALKSGRVPVTIFRATSFMESLTRYVQGNRATAVFDRSRPWRWLAACDYARMASRAYTLPEAAGQTFYIYGPEALPVDAALRAYCAIAHPDAKVSRMSLRMASVIATLFRPPGLAAALPFLRYIEAAVEPGDASATNALLGAPQTTISQWAGQAKGL
jgi:uncharacterized protein YbjT (DUF2867 family)